MLAIGRYTKIDTIQDLGMNGHNYFKVQRDNTSLVAMIYLYIDNLQSWGRVYPK